MSDRKILAIGDSYMDVSVFSRALEAQGMTADLATVTIADVTTWPLDSIREYEGDPAEVSAFIDGHEIIALHGASITRRVLEENPSVKFLACARGGPVNIDLVAARELGVTVTTTPGKNAEAVADLAIGFVISLLRNVMPSVRDVDATSAAGEQIAESAFEGARWFGRELRGRALGLVGLGHVARLVAARAHALGMEVFAYDPFVPFGSVEGVGQFESLEELLERVEVLSLHARATSENRHLIGAEQFAALRPGAVLVNTARESLVDEHALLEALRSGHLSGAAMDVCEANGPWRELIAQPSVILTPHIAGASYETLNRGAQMLTSEIAAYVQGKALRWQV